MPPSRPILRKKLIPKKRREYVDKSDIELEALKQASKVYERMRQRQRRLERCVIGGILFFISMVVLSAWLTDGVALDRGIKFFQSFEGKDSRPSISSAANCQHPKNKNTPYCQNIIAEQRSTWRSITRFGGKSNAFTLHGND
jgi:hypothetical protein